MAATGIDPVTFQSPRRPTPPIHAVRPADFRGSRHRPVDVFARRVVPGTGHGFVTMAARCGRQCSRGAGTTRSTSGWTVSN
ncbi:hypothetical protein GCM10023083_00710 [Streptomyces phyllanthi]